MELSLLGFSHAVLFSILTVAATGKLAGCGFGSRAMCVKGSLDGLLAMGIVLLSVPFADKASALVSLLIGGGGLLKEHLLENSLCNCYGVLTSLFQPWRNHMRYVMIVSASIILALGKSDSHYDEPFYIGALSGLAIAIIVVVFLYSRATLLSFAKKIDDDISGSPAHIPLDLKMVIGVDHLGKPKTVGDLMIPGKPLAIILTEQECEHCIHLKRRLIPLLQQLPFPALIIEDHAAEPSDGRPAVLFDARSTLAAHAGATAMPAMIIVDQSTMHAEVVSARLTLAVESELLQMTIPQLDSGNETRLFQPKALQASY